MTKVRVEQNERHKVTFASARARLGLERGHYDLKLHLGGDSVAVHVERAALGKQYLSSWTRMYDATQGRPLLAWCDASRGAINFSIATALEIEELAETDEALRALRGFARRRAGLSSVTPAVTTDLVSRVRDQCVRLGIDDVTQAPLTDSEVLEQLNLSWLAGTADVGAVVGRGRLQVDFRIRLVLRYGCCVFCGCTLVQALEAAHVLPWSRCVSDDERADEANGLLLCATHHRLFDRDVITIDNDLCLQVHSSAAKGTEAADTLKGRELDVTPDVEEGFRDFLRRRPR